MKKYLLSLLFIVLLFSNLLAVQDGTGNDVVDITKYSGTPVNYIRNNGGFLESLFNGTYRNIGMQPPNLVYVFDNSDLPEAIGGVIDLVDNIRYIFPRGEQITITDKLKLGEGTYIEHASISTNSSIEFANGTLSLLTQIQDSSLIYTGTGSFLSTADTGAQIIRLLRSRITCTNGVIFDLSTTIPSGIFIFDQSSILAAEDIGTIEGMGFVSSISRFINFGDGLKLVNNYQGIDINTLQMQQGLNNSIKHIDISGTCQQLSIRNFLGKPKSNEKIFYLNPNLAYESIVVANCPIDLSESGVDNTNIFDTGSLDNTSIGVKFTGNVNIPDSKKFVSMYYVGLSSVTTSNPTPQNFVTTWQENNLERFTSVSTGTVTYIGVENINVIVSLDLTISVAAASSWSFYLYKNGVQISNFPYNFDITIQLAGNKIHVFPKANVNLKTGDYLEIRLSGNNSTLTTYDGQGYIWQL